MTPLLKVGLLFIFMHLSCVHLTTLKVNSVSQTPPNFEQRTSMEVANNSRNEAKSLRKSSSYLHKLECQSGVSAKQPLPGGLGSRGQKKRVGGDRWSGAKWINCDFVLEKRQGNLFT